MNSDIELSVKKSQLNKKKKLVIRSVMLFILLIFIILVITLIINYRNNVKFYEKLSLYQYHSGIKFEYEGKLTLTKKSGIIDLKSDKYKLNLDSSPVYVKGKEHKVILPKTMGVFNPSVKNKGYKVSKLTMVKTDFDLDNQSYLMNEYNNIFLDKSFMFDGEDTYVFFDDVTLFVGEDEYKLSPLSYVSVRYHDEFYFYNYQSDKFVMMDSFPKDILLKYGKYTINLSTDMIMYSDGTFKLLPKNVGKLPLYKNDIVTK